MGSRFVRLSATDRINLAVEAPDTPMQVGAVVMLAGDSLCDTAGCLRLADIRAVLECRLADVPRLRHIIHQPPVLAGGPVWVDDPAFRIERHVNRVEAPPPGDEPALLRLAIDLMAVPLDRAHPLWRIWFVTGLRGGRVAAVVGLHHVVADGLAAMRLITGLLDPPAGPGREPAPPSWVPAAPPRWRSLVHDNAVRVLRSARPARRRRAGASPGAWRLFARSWRAPRTSLNGPIGPRRRLAVLRLDLAAAKEVAHEHGGKVNDVVLALAAGGLRALLASRGEPVDGVSVNASVAVSLRTPEQAAEAGNQTGGLIIPVPLGEPDPGARLRRVCAATAAAKRGQMVSAGNSLLVWLARLGLVRWVSRRQRLTNLVESNVTGPVERMHVLGEPVLGLVPLGVLAGNISISFLALSYAGRLTVTVLADADQHPDLPVVTTAMERDWAALLPSARAQSCEQQVAVLPHDREYQDQQPDHHDHEVQVGSQPTG
jgi:diacylglycerol O-acyltransferase / wax synthase